LIPYGERKNQFYFILQPKHLLRSINDAALDLLLAWIPTEADVSNKILSKVIILGHPAWEEVSQLQNL
jgi:hypothetical protein